MKSKNSNTPWYGSVVLFESNAKNHAALQPIEFVSHVDMITVVHWSWIGEILKGCAEDVRKFGVLGLCSSKETYFKSSFLNENRRKSEKSAQLGPDLYFFFNYLFNFL